MVSQIGGRGGRVPILTQSVCSEGVNQQPSGHSFGPFRVSCEKLRSQKSVSLSSYCGRHPTLRQSRLSRQIK
eukprot:COSAG06_NODE_838_length_12005_cov_473.630354_2_plen_72_part_00